MRARVLFAFMREGDNSNPIVMHAIDETIWEHEDVDEADRLREIAADWPPEYEFRFAWLTLDDRLARAVFSEVLVPAIVGTAELPS